jgi:hypothetical protein
MKTIDDATPEDWNALRKKPSTPVADTWNRIYDDTNTAPKEHLYHDDDNEPNEHPVFSEEAMAKSYDVVNRPEHYNNGGMECIDAIQGMLTHDEYIGYLRGNALKYNWRCRYKGKPIEDLRKARWYEERLIRYMLEHPGDKLG